MVNDLSLDLIGLVRTCQHEKPVEKTVGRKKKYHLCFCPDCGLVLDMKEVK